MNKKKLTLLWLICFPLFVWADELICELPVTGDPFPTELFWMEPYYTNQKEIETFRMGEFIQIRYQKDKDGKITHKYYEYWDKNDFEWNIKYTSFYEYEKGRLKEIRTCGLLPEMKEFNLEYKYKTIYHAQIVYDPVSYTDTVTIICKDLPLDGNATTQAHMQYIRHYTDNDRLTLLQYISKEGEPQLNKEYIYDKEGRITEIRSYYMDEDAKWQHGTSETYSYLDKKITYTLKEEFIREENKKPSVAEFTVYLDNKGFITGKEHKVNEVLILKDTYKRNPDGSYQSIHHEQYYEKYIVGLHRSLLSFHLTQEIRNHSYRITYTPSGCVRSHFYLPNEKKKEWPISDIEKCYGKDGKLIAGERILYDSDGKQDEHPERIQITYSADGLVTEKTWFDLNEKTGKTDNPHVRRIIKTLPEVNGTETEYYRHDYWQKTWDAENKTIYHRDENGFTIYYESAQWDKKTNKWIPSAQTSYIRDEQNRILFKESKRERYNTLTNNSREFYTYGPSGEKTVSRLYEWDDSNNRWNGSQYDSIHYEGDIAFHFSFGWHPEIEWFYSRCRSIDRVEEDEQTKEREITYHWDGEEWQKQSMKLALVENEKREKDNQLLYWYPDPGFWYMYSRDREYRDENNYQIEEAYRYNSTINKLEGIQHIGEKRYRLDENRVVREKIYGLWDYEKEEWFMTIRHRSCIFENSGEEDEEDFFDIYDRSANIWKNQYKIHYYRTDKNILNGVQSLWNEEKQEWENEKKIEFYGYSRRPSKKIAYLYDKTTGQWKPELQFERLDEEQDQFSEYNPEKKEWEPYMLIVEDWPGDNHYYMDERTGEWAEVTNREWIRYQQDSINEIFSLKEKVEYNQMVINNRPSVQEN